MPLVIPNTTSQAEYVKATTFGGAGLFVSGFVTITGSALCYLRLIYGPQGTGETSVDFILAPGTYGITGTHKQPVAGLAIKDFLTGTHVQFSGALFAEWEAALGAGAPTSAQITSTGAVSFVGAGEELAYNEITANVTVSATTAPTANLIVSAPAVTFDGSTVALIEFFGFDCRTAAAAGAELFLELYEDGVDICPLGTLQAAGASGVIAPLHCERRMTPSAGAHTYSVRGYVSGGNGLIVAGSASPGAKAPAFIRITQAA